MGKIFWSWRVLGVKGFNGELYLVLIAGWSLLYDPFLCDHHFFP